MTHTIEHELLTLENKYWQAIKDKNMEAALDLTADPCIVAGASGIGKIDKEAFREMMKNAKYTLNDFKIKDDVKVQQLTDDVAVLAYEVHEDLTVEGKSVVLDAAETSTWVRQNGRWICAIHTESIAGDSFGRDKVAQH